DGSPLGDSSPSHCACVILRHCRQRSRACVTTTDPFSIMEKSDESQVFENMTIYLKTKKMLSQWTKQMRWRIKKSLPSFVLKGTYVVQHNSISLCCKPFCCLSMRDYVEPYAVNRLCLSMRNVRDYYPPKDYYRVATVSHSLWLPGGLAPPCRVISNGRKSLYERHTAFDRRIFCPDGACSVH